MFQRNTTTGSFGFGSLGPPPRDLLILLGVIFVTFTLRFFSGTAIVPALLSLTPAVYQLGFLWQLVTYPFVGLGAPGLWFLLELFILYWFGLSVFHALGRRRFWRLLGTSAFVAALAAVLLQLVMSLAGAELSQAFFIMQGQRMVTIIVIAAFATLFRDATILLFFVLPIRARWFLWLEILFGFMAFLGTKDLPGFLGIVVAVGVTYGQLVPGTWQRWIHRWRLRADRLRYQRELRKLRKDRNFRIVKDEDDEPRRGPWVN